MILNLRQKKQLIKAVVYFITVWHFSEYLKITIVRFRGN